MVVTGWIAVAAVGGYVVFAVVVLSVLTVGRGGLEDIPLAVFLGTVVTIAWLALIAWLSPLHVGWTW